LQFIAVCALFAFWSAAFLSAEGRPERTPQPAKPVSPPGLDLKGETTSPGLLKKGQALTISYKPEMEVGPVIVVQVADKPEATDPPGEYHQVLGNFQAFKADSKGKPTKVPVGTFSNPLILTLLLPAPVVKYVGQRRLEKSSIYFWDPTKGKWIDTLTAASGEDGFKVRKVKWDPVHGTIILAIDAWPADDSMCAFGG
jgi:hypothetical protein